MPIVSTIVNLGIPSSLSSTYIVALKNALVSLGGWTVPGSSDGATGGMDGIDRVTSAAQFTSGNAWFVLQSPHASPADRIQLFVTGDSNNPLAYDPSASYSGGAAAVDPVSAYARHVQSSLLGSFSSDALMYLTLDTSAPFGFASTVTARGDAFQVGGLSFIPLSSTASNGGKPYIVALAPWNTSGAVVDTTGSPGQVIEPANPPQIPVPAGIAPYGASGLIVSGRGLQPDPSLGDPSLPVVYYSYNRTLLGSTSFIRLHTIRRAPLTTFNDRTRITFYGYFSVPWDGVTAPIY